MLASIDIETDGLDATKFILGSYISEDGHQIQTEDKTELWDYVLKEGYRCAKQGKVLYLYAHNHAFDFYGYANYKDNHLHIIAETPFIANYMDTIKGKNRKIIAFLDSYAIFRLSLKELAESIGKQKMEMPTQDRQKLKEYNLNDTQLVLDAILYLKAKLQEDGIHLKRYITKSQISINYLLNLAKNEDGADLIFRDREKLQLIWPKNSMKIHSAYKGARTQCFKLGLTKGVWAMDINSLYPYSLTQIKIPDLKTETLCYPSRQYWEQELKPKIGIARCMIENVSDPLGCLVVRIEPINYFPTIGKRVIGTWTHMELYYALKHGWKLLDVEWSLYYEEGKGKCNPFKKPMEILYKKRHSWDPFDNLLYKTIMNYSIGKMAQTRISEELVIDSVERVQEYIDKNYKAIKGIDKENYIYRKNKENPKDKIRKPFYSPIIPCLVNAYARVEMHKYLSQIPIERLVYTDTDSIIWKYDNGDEKRFKFGSEMGRFKIEAKDTDIFVYGNKTYRLGEDIKIAGVHKADITREKFDKGLLETKRMISLSQAKEELLPGMFLGVVKDLVKQQGDTITIKGLLDAQKVYIDEDVENVARYSKYLDAL